MRDHGTDKKRLSLRIGNMNYSFQANEDPDYMREVAAKADEMFQTFKASYPGMSDLSVAILSLVNAIDIYEKLKAGGELAEAERDKLNRALDESHAECLRMREQSWELKKDLIYYRNLCEIYEERLAEISGRTTPPVGKKTAGRESKRPLDRMQRSFSEISKEAELDLQESGAEQN